MPSVAETIAASLADAGIERAFGLLGEGNLAIATALERQGRTKWVALRREDAVLCAADGYAQGTGQCGVALVTHGPALTNTITPLVGACKGQSPLVVITGEIAAKNAHLPQFLDQARLIGSVGVPYRSLARADAAAAFVRDAISEAMAERHPVVLGIPTVLQHAPSVPAEASIPGGAAPTAAIDEPASPDELRAAAAALRRARRPLLLAGRGAEASREQLVQLAERTGCLLSTSLLAKGLFAGHPRDVGVCGGFASDRARAAIAQADLVLAFGASLNDYTTGSGALLRHATVVQVDHDPKSFGRRYTPDLIVRGDAARVAVALADLAGEEQTNGRWTHASAPSGPGFADESDHRGLDLRSVSLLLDRALAPERCFVSDLGYFTSEPCKYVSVPDPRYQAFCLHFGSIGMGLATAIGLSAAHPNVPTLCAVGDGGLAACLGELETLSRLRLPVTVAVYNDSAYGVEWQALRQENEPTGLSEFPEIDFAATARALGIPAITAQSLDDFPTVAGLLHDAESGPRLVDFKLNRTVVTNWYRELVLGPS